MKPKLDAVRRRDALILSVLAIPLLLPPAVIGLIITEGMLFRTRYLSDGLEAIGLTPVLQAIFTALDMNG